MRPDSCRQRHVTPERTILKESLATPTGRSRHTVRKGGRAARCGTPMVREHFMNGSSNFCPKCQRRPRMTL